MEDIFKPEKLFVKNKLTELGLTEAELKKPLVLVLYEDGCIGPVADVKLGIITGGCACAAFSLPSLDENGSNALGKELMLTARESVADLTEILLSVYSADGAVLIGSSESCLAGMVMGTVRKNVPFTVLPPYIKAKYSLKQALTGRAQISSGKKSLTFAEEIPFNSGRSTEMDNINSLLAFFKGAGISLFYTLQPETPSEKIVYARQTGSLAAQRALNLGYPKKEMDIKSFTNGVLAHLSAGGTSASLLHIIAIGRENGLDVDFEFISSLSQKNQSESPIGLISGNIFKAALYRKESADKTFKGKALVYENEELARGAILSGADCEGCAIVIKRQSNNGMPLLDIESALIAMEIKNALILTDGRTYELGCYTVISLADKTEIFDVMQTGDIIEIDFKKGKINLNVPSKEINSRLKKNTVPQIKSGALLRYINFVEDCDHGRILKNKF